MTTVRFSGESPWDAIVNHKGLDVVLEGAFMAYCVRRGYHTPKSLPLETLEELYAQWQQLAGRHYL